MLSELYIENLAVIQKAEIPFAESFNVFTGETGAGKTILINGINAVLGKRVSKDIVRSGCDKAVVTAMFRNLTEVTKNKLAELGISFEDDELMITREISADGGSTARINSKPTAVSVIKEIGETLIDVHGQHDNRILMYPEKHINIVDGYAELDNELADYQQTFKHLQTTARKIKQLALLEQEKQQRVEFLNQFINDVGALELDDENEDTLVENEFNVANNSAVLADVLSKSHTAMLGDDDYSGMTENVDTIIKDFSNHTEIIPELSKLTDRLETVKIEITDIASEVSRLLDAIDIDEQRYDYLSERREQLYNVKKRYSCTLAELISRYNSYTNEANEISGYSKEIETLTIQKEQLLIEVSEKAEKLSELRKEAAEKLMEKIAEELKFLDMPNVKIVFEQTKGKLTSMGMDTMEMLISVNPGEPLKPIAKIASGGELSRIMLAIKNVLSDKDDIGTLIFDEIDAGVSGSAAEKIALKLYQVSKGRQVICVTHLARIAAQADRHMKILKSVEDSKTFTSVTVLDFEQRAAEVARITAGDAVTALQLETAKEMLLNAAKGG